MATRLIFGLGIVSVLAVGVSFLALNDIAHGAGGSAEWNALRVTFALILLFQLAALTTLWRLMRPSRP